MKEKKNIDRLFQEKFKDFEVQPDPKVWQAIVDAKDKKEDRVIPLWLKWAGVAAFLAGLLIGGNVWLGQTEMPLVNNTAKPEVEDRKPQNKLPINNSANEKMVQKTAEEESSTRDQETGTVVSQNKREASEKMASTLKGTMVSEKTSKNRGSRNLAHAEKTSDYPEAPDGISTETVKTEGPLTKGRITSTDEAKKLLSIGNLLAQKNAEIPTLEELLDAKKVSEETIEEKEVLASKWGIMPNVAPVYYGSTGGSGIDPQFGGNEKTGQVNLSYGLQVSYAVNDRVTVRSGLNRLDLSYNTHDISYSPVVGAQPIASIDYNGNSEILNLESNAANRSNLDLEFANLAEFKSNPVATQGSLTQSLNYLEIPLELEYVLVDKKFGLQAIGGVSTMLLTNNFIAIQAQNENIEIGASNSLNPTSFSANVGLGLDYRFSKKLQFNLEPMFKYQMNAYTNTVSDFRPYYMGLYTGIKIAF